MLNASTQRSRGDTIVEALLALAIAAFAIGIAYATANRSLNQAITARERNQALNLIQNQITDLRIRYAGETPTSFSSKFGYPHTDFCLNDKATLSSDPQWPLYQNTFGGAITVNSFPLGYINTPTNLACVRNIPGQATPFYINITPIQISPVAPGVNDTVFQVAVRWDRLGGGINQASELFRPNGKIN